MAGNRRPDDDEAEARRIIAQINTETAATGLPRARSVLERAQGHFSGADADPDDRVEVWGRRIGRGVSLVLFVVLVIWLLRFAAGQG